MEINQSGEAIRKSIEAETIDKSDEIEESTDTILTNYYDALGTQSILPDGLEAPSDIKFWSGERLQHNIAIFEKMQEVVKQHQLTEFSHVFNQEHINIADLFLNIQKSIAFSKDINERKKAGEFVSDETDDAAAEARRQLFLSLQSDN